MPLSLMKLKKVVKTTLMALGRKSQVIPGGMNFETCDVA